MFNVATKIDQGFGLQECQDLGSPRAYRRHVRSLTPRLARIADLYKARLALATLALSTGRSR